MLRKFVFTFVAWAALGALLLLSPRSARADSVITNCSNDSQLTAALASGGTITFNCGTATILFNGYKVINTATTIDGGGKITFNGGNSTRFFVVGTGQSLTLNNLVLTNGYSGGSYGGAIFMNAATLTLNNTTIQNSQTNGYSGGAIFAFGGNIVLNDSIIQGNTATYGAINTTGYLTLNRSIVRNNTATYSGGGLSVGGVVQIQDSKVESNKALQPNVLESGGGGIYTTPGSLVSLIRSSVSNNTSTRSGGGLVVQGTVTMTEVTISDNNGYGPGGIYNKGTITLNRVTISGNNATNGGLGGGIFNNGTATLTNVTISNNPTGGGFYNVGPASMTNVTVVNNGAIGGVLGRLDTLTLKNTVIAGNDDVNCDTFGGSIVSSGFNLSDDSSCTAYLNMGTDKNNVNALLGPLSFNGSTTQSHLLLHGSPAIDAGTSSGAPTIDQRGNVRPQGLAIDMGATEVCTVKPDKPYLALPGNNSKIKGLQVALDWYDAPCADKYKITIKDAATGLKVQGGKSGTSDFKTKALTKGKSYLWFVQACNTIGCTKSDTWKFTVK